MKFRELRANEIECRVNTIKAQKGLTLLLYKDARADMRILDETVGPENWQRSHELINGNLFCNVGILVGRENGIPEWVWKQDVGVESYTEKEKGQASDSFKRACVNWGIGRELYTAPFIWIPAGKYKETQGSNGKATTYDHFKPTKIAYKDGNITGLEIINESTGQVVYTYPVKRQKAAEKASDKPVREILKPGRKKALLALLSEHGIALDYVLGSCRVEKIEDISDGKKAWVETHIDNLEKGYKAWKAKQS